MRFLGPVALGLGLSVSAAAVAASRPALEAEHAMVVSEQRLASEAGLDALRAGGNAIDAAVAVGYALAVTHPCCGNIGGGGFMLVHLKDGSEQVIDFREVAPLAARAEMYLDANGEVISGASQLGWRAVAVPGTVAGFEAALSAYGRLGRARVMAPAIALAANGFVLTQGDADIINAGRRTITLDPAARRIFLKPDGSSWQAGDRLRQIDLAQTLSLISKQGRDGFYQGKVAADLLRASAAAGGILSAADLANYRPTLRDPLHCVYRGLTVSTVPPASSGGLVLCEMLNVLAGYDLTGLGFHSAQALHLMTETMRNVFRDRNSLLGDPAFVQIPTERLLSADYADEIRGHIAPDRATPSDQLPPGSPSLEKTETTHFSVVDAEGNAVAVTFTINGLFGASVMAPGTGFFLNDEMDDFTVKPGVANMFGLRQGERNMIAPGKRPLSSMTPTIVSRGDQVFLVLGSPGGARISTLVLEALVNVVDYGMAPQEAVDAGRFHHQYQPDKLFAEPYAISPDSARLLREMGYALVQQRAWGAVGLIERAPRQVETAAGATVADQSLSGALRPGWLYGASDPRRPAGAATGY